MIVGTLQIDLMLFGNDSLKGKRRVVRGLLDRTSGKFNVASAEVAAMDDHRRACLGFAVVSNDRRHANSMLDSIADFVEQNSPVPVTRREIELLHVRAGEFEDRWQE